MGNLLAIGERGNYFIFLIGFVIYILIIIQSYFREISVTLFPLMTMRRYQHVDLVVRDGEEGREVLGEEIKECREKVWSGREALRRRSGWIRNLIGGRSNCSDGDSGRDTSEEVKSDTIPLTNVGCQSCRIGVSCLPW